MRGRGIWHPNTTNRREDCSMADGSSRVTGLAVFDESTDGVLAFSDDGRYLYANRQARSLYGTDDLVGRTIAEFRPGRSSALLASELRTLLHEGHLAGEHSIRCPDGSVAAVRFRSVANHQPGVHLTVIRALAPEADEPQAEIPGGRRVEVMRAVFDHLPYAVLVIDDDRRFVEANRAARRLLGVSKNELAKRRFGDFTPEDEKPEVDRIWAALLERGSLEGRRTLMLANGIRRPIAFKATAAVTPGRHMVTVRPARGERQGAEMFTDPVPLLTAREREILALLARGHNAEGIAKQVGVAPQTVRTHVRNALRKLGARTRSHAVAIAIQQKQIDP